MYSIEKLRKGRSKIKIRSPIIYAQHFGVEMFFPMHFRKTNGSVIVIRCQHSKENSTMHWKFLF